MDTYRTIYFTCSISKCVSVGKFKISDCNQLSTLYSLAHRPGLSLVFNWHFVLFFFLVQNSRQKKYKENLLWGSRRFGCSDTCRPCEVWSSFVIYSAVSLPRKCSKLFFFFLSPCVVDPDLHGSAWILVGWISAGCFFIIKNMDFCQI